MTHLFTLLQSVGDLNRHGHELFEELSQETPELLFLKHIGAPTTTCTAEMKAFRTMCIE